jgi:hypothetical protein
MIGRNLRHYAGFVAANGEGLRRVPQGEASRRRVGWFDFLGTTPWW